MTAPEPRPSVSTAPAEGASSGATSPRAALGRRRLPAHLGPARTSTVLLALAFLAVGLLYLFVKPPPGAAQEDTATNPAPTSTAPGTVPTTAAPAAPTTAAGTTAPPSEVAPLPSEEPGEPTAEETATAPEGTTVPAPATTAPLPETAAPSS